MSGATTFTLAVKVVSIDRTAGVNALKQPLDVVHFIANYNNEDTKSNPAIPWELVVSNPALTGAIAANQTYLATFVRQT
jgi:hypothetical protein